MVQPAVQELVNLGPFPGSDGADVDLVEKYQTLLEALIEPVSDDDARALSSLFGVGPDTYFGLAWSLVHAIEKAPGWPLQDVIDNPRRSEWVSMLRDRVANGGTLGSPMS